MSLLGAVVGSLCGLCLLVVSGCEMTVSVYEAATYLLGMGSIF